MSNDPGETLRAAVERAAHLLPVQGPIHRFVHHNTLHALQGLPFHDAIAEASERLDTLGYLPESTFRECHASGRITDRDLRASYEDWASTLEGPDVMVLADGRTLQRSEVHLDILRQASSVEGVGDATPSVERSARIRRRSHRDLLLTCTGEDPALLVNSLLIRFLAAYLSQGAAPWTMPGREQGFFAAFLRLMSLRGVPTLRWARGLRERAEALARRQATPVGAVLLTLDELGVGAEDYEWYIERVLLELPGWAGMFRRLEGDEHERAGWTVAPSLMEYLAVRACLVPLALRAVAKEKLGFGGELGQLLPVLEGLVRRRAGAESKPLDPAGGSAVQRWADEVPASVRQRIWQEAYERHYRDEVLGALQWHARRLEPAQCSPQAQRPPEAQRPPRFQVVFCIDDRSESIRRHLEECSPDVQTLGVAGFFGFAVEWRGLDDPRHYPSCPVAACPTHKVSELPQAPHESRAERRRRRRVTWARVSRRVHRGTRSLEATLWSPLLGGASVVAAFLQVLFPWWGAALSAWWHRRFVPTPPTRLTALRDVAAEPEADEAGHGLPVDDAVERVATVLQDLDLVGKLAPLVLLLGHGARSRNNPHASAYDCGACGGRQGGPNARIFALAANDRRVREGLARRGIVVPDGTVFLGGQHDTTTDGIEVYGLDVLPDGHREVYAELDALLEEARGRNAHERCRRFESAPRRLSARAALRHVEARAHALDQPRPELGHATNALCVIGRRGLTRGLFLDRRAFLVEYNPDSDPSGVVLERTLAAVVPVGAGINLEYYFSRVDNDRFGCGSKLAHNLASGLGVMDGAESDLRTGLPWQMVEIHEPMRLLVVVEAAPEVLLEAVMRQGEVRELVCNEWIRLCSLQRGDAGVRFALFDPRRGFVPHAPTAPSLSRVSSSLEWYAGRTGFLAPAVVEERAPSVGAPGSRHDVAA